MNKVYSILFLSVFILNPLAAQSTASVRNAQSISEVENIDCNALFGYPAGNSRCEREKVEKIALLKSQNEKASLRKLIAAKDQRRLTHFFPDDSYVGLKCSRIRANLNVALDSMGESPFENGGWWVLNKDYQDRYVNSYSNDEYFVLSPANKKGWVIAQFIFMKKKSTDLWEFPAEKYSNNGPYEVTKFEISDYAYLVDFKDSLQLRFNREDLSFSIPSWVDRAGTCKIMDAAELFAEIDSMEERAISYKAHNKKVVDAKKAKNKF